MSDVIVEEAPDRVERRSVVVNATPSEVFDLLADPRRHHEIDGSGTVREAGLSAPERLSPGAKFGMKMKYGVPYTITNTVVDFVEDELIAWRHLGKHVWRYRLEALDGGGTKVTEEFDWRTAIFPPALKLIGAPADNAAAIEKTLTRLADQFGTPNG
ncbi:MAG: SRPBCC family protein [Ilumatobacter sp.]|uniref:SRPBCC family protein n=1 Tax=Ilumatobacter sp. TaxID=1967498 RepID=UPI0032984227